MPGGERGLGVSDQRHQWQAVLERDGERSSSGERFGGQSAGRIYFLQWRENRAPGRIFDGGDDRAALLFFRPSGDVRSGRGLHGQPVRAGSLSPTRTLTTF